jgi:FlaA1/EpsC-like NDP-sugar epimerase
MTIPEAAQLVIQAGAMATGGEVFVLDMGDPVKIVDLAERMIELSGLSLRNAANPNGDIEIEVVGLRPGEKLYEELLIGGSPEATAHAQVMKAHDSFIGWESLLQILGDLCLANAANDLPVIRKSLEALVPEFNPREAGIGSVKLQQAAC